MEIICHDLRQFSDTVLGDGVAAIRTEFQVALHGCVACHLRLAHRELVLGLIVLVLAEILVVHSSLGTVVETGGFGRMVGFLRVVRLGRLIRTGSMVGLLGMLRLACGFGRTGNTRPATDDHTTATVDNLLTLLPCDSAYLIFC